MIFISVFHPIAGIFPRYTFNIQNQGDSQQRIPPVSCVQLLIIKPATYKVTVKEIKVKELPELNDEFASEVSEFDTLDEYKKDVEKKLAEKKEIEANSKNEDAVVAKVVENATMEIPDKMIDAQAENMVQDMARRMQSQGLSLDMY